MNDEILDSNSTGQVFGVTPQIESYFKESGKWAFFLGILGFIFLAIMLLSGILMMTSLSTIMNDYPSEFGGAGGGFGLVSGGFIGFFYILMALLYFFPSLFLYRFGKTMKLAQRTGDQDTYAEGFKNLKSFFKFLGITSIVILVLYFLIFIGAFIFGAGMF